MTYGIIKVDTITFTDGGIDKSVSISGLVQNPTFSGNITVTGTISGNLVQGQTVSGNTVTGTTAAFTTGTFVSLTGTTIQGTTATYTTGSFTSLTGTTIQGTTATYTTGSFTSLTGTTAAFTTGTFTSLTGTTTTGTTATYTTGSFTSLTGTTTTGTTANFVSGVYTTQISGATITGNSAAFTTVTGGTATITSGVFASGIAAAPAISVGTTNNGIYSPGADQVAISTNGTGRLSIDANGNVAVDTNTLYVDAVNNRVAVGTTSPLYALDVAGDVAFGASGVATRVRTRRPSDGSIGGYFGYNTTGSNDIYIVNGSGSQNIVAEANSGAFIFNSSPSIERARIDSSGRLLVGTASNIPSSAYGGTVNPALQLAGTGTSANSFAQYAFNGVTGHILGRSNNATVGQHTIVAADNDLGYLSFVGSDGSAFIEAARVWAEVDGTPGANDMPGRLIFSTTADGASSPTERMRITSDGKVGVGTTSPLGKIHIQSASTGLGAVNAAGDELVIENNTTAGMTILAGNAATANIYFADSDNAQPGAINYDHSDNSLAFRVNSSERASIDSSGRLLVGTSSTPPAVETIVPQFVSSSSAGVTGAGDVAIYNFQNAAGTARTRVAPKLLLGRSRSGTNGSLGGIVLSGDMVGNIRFAGDDGSAFLTAAEILAEVDGTPGANDMPGRLIFSTTADGASSPTERMRIDSSGRLLVGTSTAYASAFGTVSPRLQVATTTSGPVSFLSYANDAFASRLDLSKSRGASVGTNTIVQANDDLGDIYFNGADGTDFIPAALIRAEVDGTPGANDMPGRLVFSTTADGAASPTERMRIGNDGRTDAFATSETLRVRTAATTAAASIVIRLQAGATSITAGGTTEFQVTSNGNVANTNNSYGAISDIKLKENIVDANSQWDDIKALQVRKYNFKEGQIHTQIGLVAQEVELVSPGLVSESPDLDEDGNDLGTVTKSVNYSVLYMKAVKALQEAMERIETLEAKVAALEAN